MENKENIQKIQTDSMESAEKNLRGPNQENVPLKHVGKPKKKTVLRLNGKFASKEQVE